jgi:hypothetical protein
VRARGGGGCVGPRGEGRCARKGCVQVGVCGCVVAAKLGHMPAHRQWDTIGHLLNPVNGQRLEICNAPACVLQACPLCIPPVLSSLVCCCSCLLLCWYCSERRAIAAAFQRSTQLSLCGPGRPLATMGFKVGACAGCQGWCWGRGARLGGWQGSFFPMRSGGKLPARSDSGRQPGIDLGLSTHQWGLCRRLAGALACVQAQWRFGLVVGPPVALCSSCWSGGSRSSISQAYCAHSELQPVA